jgi:hypothetical protein
MQNEREARLAFDKVARRYARWALSNVSAKNVRAFEHAKRALHRAAERYALAIAGRA